MVQDTSFSFLKSVLGFSRQNRRGLYLFLSLILKKFSLRNWLTGLWRLPDTFTVCRAHTQFQSEGQRAWRARVQLKSQEAGEFTFTWRRAGRPAFLLIGWGRCTRGGQSALFSLLIWVLTASKNTIRHTQSHVGPNVWAPCRPLNLSHKITHPKWASCQLGVPTHHLLKVYITSNEDSSKVIILPDSCH